jgi:broad specificity phosphatase PhoE
VDLSLISISFLAFLGFAAEAALILIRHGESLWNEKNLFTGCVDVPLTQRGVEEAVEAGKRISNIPVDAIFTSALVRAQMTAMLAMTQHRRKKVRVQILKIMSALIILVGQFAVLFDHPGMNDAKKFELFNDAKKCILLWEKCFRNKGYC